VTPSRPRRAAAGFLPFFLLCLPRLGLRPPSTACGTEHRFTMGRRPPPPRIFVHLHGLFAMKAIPIANSPPLPRPDRRRFSFSPVLPRSQTRPTNSPATLTRTAPASGPSSPLENRRLAPLTPRGFQYPNPQVPPAKNPPSDLRDFANAPFRVNVNATRMYRSRLPAARISLDCDPSAQRMELRFPPIPRAKLWSSSLHSSNPKIEPQPPSSRAGPPCHHGPSLPARIDISGGHVGTQRCFYPDNPEPPRAPRLVRPRTVPSNLPPTDTENSVGSREHRVLGHSRAGPRPPTYFHDWPCPPGFPQAPFTNPHCAAFGKSTVSPPVPLPTPIRPFCGSQALFR